MKLTSRAAADLARSFAGVTEKDHFGGDAFIANKRIFATVWHERQEVSLRLSPDQQRHFLSIDGEGFAELDNSWGKQGWTKVHLHFVDKKDLMAALQASWEYSAEKKPKSAKSKTKV